MIQPHSPAPRSFDGLVTDVARHLRGAGFDVVADIDVQAVLRQRGVESNPWRILSTCSADQAQLCNVIVRKAKGHGVQLNVVDPMAARKGRLPAPQSTASQVHRSLATALLQMGGR